MRIGQVASITDTGRKRRRNEDAFVVRPPLFAVADGMGGAQAGEVASGLATEVVREDAQPGGGEERIRALIQAANSRIYERSSADASASGMGTTITVALVDDDAVSIGHVGDSRAYRIRAGALEQLTDDHSLIGELVRSGKLSPAEAESHPQRSVITRALGTDPDVDADTFTVQAEPGDLFLLCSDGLTSMVADDAILATVERHRDDLERVARELVEHANSRGGEDNITVVFFELTDAPSVEDTAELTAPLPAAPEDDDDEDTLSELDAIPTLEQPAPAPAETREPGSGRSRLAVTGLVLLALLVLGIALLAAWEFLA